MRAGRRAFQKAGVMCATVVHRILRAMCGVSIGLGVLVTSAPRARGDGDFGSDRAQLLARIQQAPNDGANFAELAGWLFRSGDLTRALAASQEAARLEPDAARYQRLVGYIQAARGARGEAEAAFRRAATLDPAARAWLGDFYLAEAWAEYQEALRRGRPDPALDERVRGLGALAEISPELKTLLPPPRLAAASRATEVPPIFLGKEVERAVVVEKHSQTVRLYARAAGDLVLLQTYPCSTGQAVGAKERRGDRRTPNGVYVISDLLHGDRLPGLYGTLALPLNYPNAWDRRHRRSGYGIWFHGSDRLGSPFTPRDTEGCVIMRNEDLVDLAKTVVPGVTPVLIAEDIPYRPVAEWRSTVQALLHDISVPQVLAVVAGPEYTVVMHRDDTTVVREFVEAGSPPQIVANERQPLLSAQEWNEKVAGILPATAIALLRVAIQEEPQPPRIVIETSDRVEARGFRPELADRLYIDLPGVRAAPLPAVVEGHGPFIKAVHVTTVETAPPFTRLAVDLHDAVDYRVANDGNRIVVSLVTQKP